MQKFPFLNVYLEIHFDFFFLNHAKLNVWTLNFLEALYIKSQTLCIMICFTLNLL